MLTRWLFVGFVLLVAVQRLWELKVSRAHERALRAEGATEHAAGQMPWMTALHSGWLVCSVLEVFLERRVLVPWLCALAFSLFCAGQALRLLAMRTLGRRWTVKVITPAAHSEPAVSAGIYRYLRHPNYLGVILEIAALPLLHTAYLSALVFSVGNALLLLFRIRAEERALRSSSDYAQHFDARPRFWPSLRLR